MGAEQSRRGMHIDKYAAKAKASSSSKETPETPDGTVDAEALLAELQILENGRGAKTKLLGQGNKRGKRHQGKK